MMKGAYGKAFKAAFPCTVPVLTGYLFIGAAFGVMFQAKGYNFIWAIIMSILDYAGSGQYLAVEFFVPGMSFLQMIFLEFMVNIRHVFYGLSLLERFNKMGKLRWYMIFSLTDETYSLFFVAKAPAGVDETKFDFAIALLNHSYWILGSALGAIAGALLPFDSKGVEFAMTSLFVVIFLEQWFESKEHKPALIGMISAVVCLLIFKADGFILPTMLCIMGILLSCKKLFRVDLIKKGENHAG